MRTAFIGAYGYGNLGDELCLIEAMQEFPPGEPPSGGAFAFIRNHGRGGALHPRDNERRARCFTTA